MSQSGASEGHIQWLSGDHCSPDHTPALAPSLIYDRANDHRGISHPHLITSDPAKITQPQIARPESMDDSIINNRQIKSDQFPTLSDVLVTAISWGPGDRSSIFYQFHHRPDTRSHTFSALLTRHGRWQRRYYCFKSRPSRPECLGWSAFIFQTSCLRGEGDFKGWTMDFVTNKWGERLLSLQPPSLLFIPPSVPHNFSPFSHSGASLHPETRHENLIRWESLNKQTALSRCRQWQGLVSLPWHTVRW